MNANDPHSDIRQKIEQLVLPNRTDVHTVSKLIKLLGSEDRTYSDLQLELFDDLFENIISGLEDAALEVLSPLLAETDQAPPRLLERFAMDESAPIAGPVISLHPNLPEDILIKVAEIRGEDHLKFLSTRKNLTPAVTNPLIIRGSDIILSRVIDNKTAKFSTEGVNILVERSIKVDELAEKLAMRTDLPHLKRTELINAASEAVRNRLQMQFPEAAAQVDTVVYAISEAIKTRAVERAYDFHSARRRVMEVKTGKQVRRREFQYFVKHRDIEAAMVALSAMSNINVEDVAKIVHDKDPLSIISLLKAVELSADMTRQFMEFRAEETGFETPDSVISNMYERLTPTMAWSVIDAKCYKPSNTKH